MNIKQEPGSPYQQGYRDRLFGKSHLRCPYDRGTNECTQYMRGFKRAENLAWFVSAERNKKEENNARFHRLNTQDTQGKTR